MTIPTTRTIFRLGFLELLKEPGDFPIEHFITHELPDLAPDGYALAQAMFGITDAFEQAQREKRLGLR